MSEILANRPYARDELLCDDEPYAYVLLRKHKDAFCEYCNKSLEDSQVACRRCGAVKYCRKGCLDRDSVDHSVECSCLQRLPQEHADIVRFLGRILIKLRRDVEEFGGHIHIAGKRVSAKFQTLTGMFPEHDEFFQNISYVPDVIYDRLKEYLGPNDIPEKEQVIDVLKKVSYNTMVKVERVDEELRFIAYYLFLGITKLSRDCIPNTKMEIENHYLHLTALRNIEQNEKITIVSRMNYSINTVPLDRTFYQCDCTDCSKSVQESTLRRVCNEAGASGVIEESLELLDTLANSWESIKSNPPLNQIDRLLLDQRAILGPENILHMRLLVFKWYKLNRPEDVMEALTQAELNVFRAPHPVGRALFPCLWDL